MFTLGGKEHIFSYVKEVYGGTEYMGKTFHEKVLPYMSKLDNYNCLILPGSVMPLSFYIDNEKEFIVWLHNTPSQFGEEVIMFLSNPIFLERLKYIVTPSETNKKIINIELGVALEKIYVIPNAINPIESNLNRFKNPEKIKLIHTSSYDRGMPLLMDSLNSVREDFALEIYNDFYPDVFYNLPKIDSRVKFFGKTPKATVESALTDAHIFTYPTVFLETFCLSLAESMSAGLMPIYPDHGALKEVSGGRGLMYDYVEDPTEHIKVHANKLQEGIEIIKDGAWDPTEQIEYINNKYSWDAIRNYWIEFEKLI